MNKLTLFILFFVGSFNCLSQPIDAVELVDKMFKAIDNSKYLTFDFYSEERFEGFIQKNTSFVKLSVEPKKMYLKMVEPNEGTELLFNPDLFGNNKVYLNPNLILSPNLKLDKKSRLLTRNQHHGIDNMGFVFLKEIIETAFVRGEGNLNDIFFVLNDVEFDGKDCYVLEIIDPSYSTKEYTVQANQDIFDIAYEQKISEYSIVELNRNVSSLYDITEGQKIQIPTSYAPKSVFYIDKQTYLPVMQEISDENGLFERYEFNNLVIHQSFYSDEFTPDFRGYNF